jgi:uncharacterized protein YjbI with pentapeptide repeats
MPTCKGLKKDGTQCKSTAVLANGYCRHHQDQATAEILGVPGLWTRERLEAAIADCGGPERLALENEDLSGLDLWGIDLRGARLTRCNLSETILECAKLTGAHLYHVVLEKAHLDMAWLDETKGWHVNLREAELRLAVLSGAKLEDADLSGALLQDARLVKTKLYRTNLQEATLASVDMRGALLIGDDLKKANLFNSNLRDASLAKTDLQGARLERADLQSANLLFADLTGVDLLDVKKGGLLGVKLYGARLDRTRLKKEQLGSAIYDEQEDKFERARCTYQALKQNFESLGDYGAASWAYIKERQMEKACSAPWRARRFYGKEQLKDTSGQRLPAYRPRVWWFFVRHTYKWLSDWFVEILCGYGEGIGRVLGWMAFLLLIAGPGLFGLPAMLKWPTETKASFFSLRSPWRHVYVYLQYLLYTLDTFTTASFAELQPASSFARLLSGCFALVGISLTGLLGFVVGNRIRRS